MKKAKALKRVDKNAYLYVTTTCPECSANLCVAHSVEVEVACNDVNSTFLSRLDAEGWLEDAAGHVAKGLHSATNCVSCGHDLMLYEAKGFGQPAPEHHHLFKWSCEDLIGLAKFPPGDVSGLAQQLCRYVIDNHHHQLAYGEPLDLVDLSEEVIAHVNQLIRVWALRAQDHTEQWRHDCEQEDRSDR